MGIFIGRIQFVSGAGHGLEIPDQTGPRERLEQIVGNVYLPPVKALARGAHKAVMVVVPAFAEGDEREDQAVAAVVPGLVTSFAEQVRKGIDAGRGVKQRRGADKEAPDEQLPRGDAERGKAGAQELTEAEQRRRQQKGNKRVKTIQENQLGKFRQVAHL